MYKLTRLMLILSLIFAVSCATATTNTPETPVDPVIDKVLPEKQLPEKQPLEKQVLVDRFGFDKGTVPSRSQKAVKDVAAKIKTLQDYDKVYLTGHTDNVGSKRRNDELSEERAQAVADMLIKEGIPKVKISAIGLGATEPITSNKTSEGRAKNRRVEIEVK